MAASATTVLVHGGGSTARFWDRLLPHLDGPHLAVDLPGRAGKPGDLATLTVDDEATSAVADVRAAGVDGPIALVAHSSGGLVVPGVLGALGHQVTHVVLNAASVPPDGGCGLDCMKQRHREGVVAALADAERAGTTLLTLGPPADPESFRTTYGGAPLTDDQLAFVVDPVRCVVDTLHHYLQPIRWSETPPVPLTYVATTLDRPVPIELQRTMAGHLPGDPTVIEVESGHVPAITDPAGFAALLRAAVPAA